MLSAWFPFIKDTAQRGLSSTSVTTIGSGATLNDYGKLGKCYYFDGTTNGYMTTNFPTNIGTSDFSLAVWVKIPAITSGTYFTICTSKTNAAAGVGFGIYWNYSQKKFLWSTADGSAGTEIWMANTVDTLVYDKWIHLVMVRNSSDSKVGYFYINGERYELASVPAIRNIATATNLNIGKTTNGYYPCKMYMNDLRVYTNHALSQKEVKLLSQGLVAHYQLNDPYSTSNLIPNGNGDLGASGWSVSYNISTTEIPAVQTKIKASYYTNINNTYIPITQGTSYNFSVWLKQKESSGKTYPSFYPYDVDKKFIYHQSCADGFGAAYTTTLAQPLKKGDTVIYATDLSAWTTATNNYYFYCAIFGYKDSFGHTYADMTYTGDSPAFGTYSDKSHIDKTNNTITLNAPFTGEDRPAGTLICQATQGSGYYYPVGGIDVTAISDWTFKSTTITPSTVNRLKYAKYIQFYAYPNAYYAGISLTDNQYMPEIVYDSSGYNYHGVSVDTEIASISPRNSFSTDFNSVTSYIEFPNLSFMPTMLPDEWTFSFWVYNNDAGSRSILFSNFNLGGVGSNSFGFEKTTGELLRVAYVSGNFDRTIPNSTLTVRVWTHIAVSKTKAHLVSVYRNGVLIDSYTNSNCASSGVLYRMGRDSRTDSTMYRGCLSDFRIYTTVLSADDILALYNAPVSIANNGTMFTQGEFVEG